MFRLHGIPKDIVSDRGQRFTSRMWRIFCAALGAMVSLSSGYHPQSNGQTERMNQSSRTLSSAWQPSIPPPEAPTCCGRNTCRTLWSRSFWCLPLHGSAGLPAVPSVQAHLCHCRGVWRQVRAALFRSSLQTQQRANRRHFPAPRYHPGRRVWLSSKDLPLQVDCRKLTQQFVGPFEVEQIVNPDAVQLRLPASMKVHPRRSTSHESGW